MTLILKIKISEPIEFLAKVPASHEYEAREAIKQSLRKFSDIVEITDDTEAQKDVLAKLNSNLAAIAEKSKKVLDKRSEIDGARLLWAAKSAASVSAEDEFLDAKSQENQFEIGTIEYAQRDQEIAASIQAAAIKNDAALADMRSAREYMERLLDELEGLGGEDALDALDIELENCHAQIRWQSKLLEE